MKIALLSWSISNNYATAIILKLLKEGHDVSKVVIKKKDTILRRIQLNLGKLGLRGIFKKGINKISEDNSKENQNKRSYLKEYINQLGYSADVTLKSVLDKNGISYIFVNSIGKSKSLSHLRSVNPDIIIFAGGGIIRKNLLDIPKIGILNAHMGFLPQYKGMNVLEWSLFYGGLIGITIHFIDEGIDTGDLLVRKEIPIRKGDTIDSLREKSQPISVEALAETINKLQSGEIERVKQEKEGKQYFVMHRRLKNIIEEKLHNSNK